MGEFGGSGDRQRAGLAADGVDQVVVADGATGAQRHRAGRGVDALGGVDQQRDAVTEDVGVGHHRVVGAGDQLVQPDPLDELGPWVDQRDRDVAVEPQVVGGDDTCVSATDHDNAGLLLGHFCSFEIVSASLRMDQEPV